MRSRWLFMFGASLLASASCAQGSMFTGVGGLGGSTSEGNGGDPSSVTTGSTTASHAGSGGHSTSNSTTSNTTSTTSTTSTTTTSGAGGACGASPCKLTEPQCGCPSGEQCGIDNDAVACVADGFDSIGSQCGTSSADTCTAGAQCVTTSATVSTCYAFCDSDADCTFPGGLCLVTLDNGLGGSIANAKLCTANCNPIGNVGCPVAGTGCQLLQESAGQMRTLTDCRGAGTKGQMVACDPTLDECKPGFGCFNIGTMASPQDVCLRYCDANIGVCPGVQSCTSLSVTLGGTSIGVCF